MIPHVARVSTGWGWWRGRRNWFILDAMLLFYLDEYGNSSLSPASIREYPYLLMGTMCIRDSQRWSLFNHVAEAKSEFFPNWEHSPWQDSELKGKHLAGAIRRLEKNLSPQTPKAYQQISYGRMQELIDRIFQIFRRFTPVFYFVGVDKQRLQDDLRKPTSPIAAAYVILQLQAARLVEGVYNMGEGGMFIADEQNQHERLFRKGEVHALRDYVVGIAGHPPDMRGILDKPLWVNKGELEVDREILQLIDIAVYSVGNALVSGDWNQKWFQNLVPYIASNWNGDEVWDGGIIIFPPPASYPVL